MARHTAKPHKIRKVKILVIQIIIFKSDIINYEVISMKYLVVSDIHGALSGAQAVQESFNYHNAERILCLGDILYHGPRNELPKDYAPKKVIEIMNSLSTKIIAVRGNCEAEVDQMVLSFPCMADYNIIPCQNFNAFLSHGHIYGPTNLPNLNPHDVFLSGHTHIPTAYKREEIFFCNPGSVSLPKENHPKTYGILEDNQFTVYTLDHQIYMKIQF